MFKKIILPALLFLVSGFIAQIANAVPAAPSPTCEIKAIILSAAKKTTNLNRSEEVPIDYYAVKLKIETSLTYQQDGGGSCEDLVDQEANSIVTLSEYKKIPVKAGQEISARIHYGGDERLGGYFLTNVEILKEGVPTVEAGDESAIKSSQEIYDMLVEQKQLKTVEDIKLDSEKKQYSVTGYRNAKLLFFIPISLKVELKIDALTGDIKQMNKPWWGFLVR
ncbi:MAG: hypothetical protein PHC53_02975 [Patescibacteria group bacterium]|nr:hypothetical protein [Patescibacteria group bacterium]